MTATFSPCAEYKRCCLARNRLSSEFQRYFFQTEELNGVAATDRAEESAQGVLERVQSEAAQLPDTNPAALDLMSAMVAHNIRDI